jgi:hypothetical protein
MSRKIKIEKTELEEKETFIHIDEFDKTATITTHCSRVFNQLYKVYGEPHEKYPPIKQRSTSTCEYISGASWKFNYKEERNKLKPIFSMGKLLPHS